MGRFYFDLGTSGGLHLDDHGVEFESTEAAYLAACAAASDIATEVDRQRRDDPAAWWFEIRDARRRLVMDLPFQEALTELRRVGDGAVSLLWAEVLERNRRNRRLMRELREGLESAQRSLAGIRETLNRLDPPA